MISVGVAQWDCTEQMVGLFESHVLMHAGRMVMVSAIKICYNFMAGQRCTNYVDGAEAPGI